MAAGSRGKECLVLRMSIVRLRRRLVAVISALVSAAAAAPSVLCIGETLFDGLPSAIYLGGAPLNVACHLAQAGVRARYLSAVGHDRLGTEAVRRLQAQGVDTDLIVQVREAETGFVTVELDRSGDASYTFVTPLDAATHSHPELPTG